MDDVQTFQKAADEFVALGADEEVTVGASVSWDGYTLVGAGLSQLCPLFVDSQSRIWKESHGNGTGSLVCILDLRNIVVGGKQLWVDVMAGAKEWREIEVVMED